MDAQHWFFNLIGIGRLQKSRVTRLDILSTALQTHGFCNRNAAVSQYSLWLGECFGTRIEIRKIYFG